MLGIDNTMFITHRQSEIAIISNACSMGVISYSKTRTTCRTILGSTVAKGHLPAFYAIIRSLCTATSKDISKTSMNRY